MLNSQFVEFHFVSVLFLVFTFSYKDELRVTDLGTVYWWTPTFLLFPPP